MHFDNFHPIISETTGWYHNLTQPGLMVKNGKVEPVAKNCHFYIEARYGYSDRDWDLYAEKLLLAAAEKNTIIDSRDVVDHFERNAQSLKLPFFKFIRVLDQKLAITSPINLGRWYRNYEGGRNLLIINPKAVVPVY